jgi:predicted DNA-binding WGR domain protein
MGIGKRKLLQEYYFPYETIDLHKLDIARNHDKVYHIAIAERPDGKFDVLCRYGRRGNGMQDYVAGEGLTLSSAENIAYTKMREKQSENYQDSPGITFGIWNDIVIPSTTTPPDVVEPQQEERPSLSSNAEIPDYAPQKWFY